MFNLRKSSSKLYDQNIFDDQFMRDLRKARKSVIIESPFLRTARVEKFIPIFHRLKKRGVAILLNTKPLEEHDEPLSQWSNIVGMDFTSHNRFSYQYTVSDIDERYIGNRTLHFWAIAQPTPANLANIIVDSIYKISKELGIDKWK